MREFAAALALLVIGIPSASCAGEPGSPWRADARRALADARQLGPAQERAKNVILFIGDGMGLTTITAARILEGQRAGGSGEENSLAFERLPHVSLSKPYNTNQQTPDSAGTITAILTGEKTRAGVLSVDSSVPRGEAAAVEGHRLRTLFEEAEARGLATGVVTTTTVTHATPGACYAHTPERSWEDDSQLSEAARKLDFPDIARQLVEFPIGDGIDVVLGGGRRHFLPTDTADPERTAQKGRRQDGRNLLAEWSSAHPRGRYVWNRTDFEALSAADTPQLWGLFEPGHLQFESDRRADPNPDPSLSEMTARAIEILSRNESGFVLMVEGGRIDHAHHLGNAYRALTDTIELSEAVRVALEKTDASDTLVLVTADHGHVLTIGGYPKRGNPILGIVVGNDAKGNPSDRPSLDALGLPYTTLGYHNGPGYTGANAIQPEGPKQLTYAIPGQQGIRRGRPDLTKFDTHDPDYLQESAVPMLSETHSAEDVPVYAGGPGAHLFHGVQEQSYLFHAIVEALGWTDD